MKLYNCMKNFKIDGARLIALTAYVIHPTVFNAVISLFFIGFCSRLRGHDHLVNIIICLFCIVKLF